MSNKASEVGTRDFFEDSGEMLRKSDTPHILIAGYNEGAFAYRSCNITLESLPWFKRELMKYLDELEVKGRKE